HWTATPEKNVPFLIKILLVIKMSDINQIAVFEEKNIRRIWHQEDWWYSVIDVVGALTESSEPKRYWSDIKIKLKDESGIEPYDYIVPL
ncbi:MAG TPA: hypothetical protein PLK55_03310, partial [archaeon]|nr:hypothetical protein [archaeon]